MGYKFSSYMTSVRYTIKLLLHLSEAGTWPPWYPMFKKRKTHCRSRVSRVERQQSNTAVLPNHCWLALPYSRSSGIVFVMKLEKLVTRAYTPGLFCWAQPSPKLTTPACTQVPFTIGQMRGPPESPWARPHIQAHIQHSPLGGVKVLQEESSYSYFPMQLAYAVCIVQVQRSPTGWFNCTWQESLPPSLNPAQTMSCRMSTLSVGSVWYHCWHELWEMIGTWTSCNGPAPCKGTGRI